MKKRLKLQLKIRMQGKSGFYFRFSRYAAGNYAECRKGVAKMYQTLGSYDTGGSEMSVFLLEMVF